MKCLTRESAIERYGHIDLASGFWPNESTWIKLLKIPAGWFPNWKVLNTEHPVNVIACNVDMHVSLMAALTEVRFYNLTTELRTFDGCFNIRAVRGSPNMSTHAYGLGIDLNAAENPLGSNATTFSKQFVDCFIKHGFDWGGNFFNRKDPMHFSYAWEGH